MRKLIKKYGDSLVILLGAEDCKVYGFEEGQVVDFEPCIIKKGKNGKS